MKTSLHRFYRGALCATLLATPWIGISQTAPSAPAGGGSQAGAAQSGTSGANSNAGRTGTATGNQPNTGNANRNQGGTQTNQQAQRPGSANMNQNQPGVNQQGVNQPGVNQPGLNQQGVNQPGTTTTPGAIQQPGASQNQSQFQQPGNTQTQSPGSSGSTGTATQPGNAQITNPGLNTGINAGVAGTSTATTGTIGTFDANGFTLAGTAGGAATNFITGPSTVFTDTQGRMVPRERITATTPVSVQYTQAGDNLVATRVIVGGNVSAAPAGGSSSAGTIREVSPGVLVMEQPGASSTPVRYVNDQTTNYVDQNGNPIPPESVQAGTPVKVFYTKVGDTLVASRVEVQQGPSSGLPKPPVESSNSTTTTGDPNR